MPTSSAKKELSGLVQELSLSPSAYSPASKPKARAREPLAESWEEAANSSSSSASRSPSPPQTPAGTSLPRAPPPTPINAVNSSSFRAHDLSGAQFSAGSNPRQGPSAEVGTTLNHRPEKQIAVAGRMIAGALGVKAPPKSAEARAYENVVREKEKKRLAREREGKRIEAEEAERAKREVWDS